MEWTSPVGTALGAAIGVGATLLADRRRRERQEPAQTSAYATARAAEHRARRPGAEELGFLHGHFTGAV